MLCLLVLTVENCISFIFLTNKYKLKKLIRSSASFSKHSLSFILCVLNHMDVRVEISEGAYSSLFHSKLIQRFDTWENGKCFCYITGLFNGRNKMSHRWWREGTLIHFLPPSLTKIKKNQWQVTKTGFSEDDVSQWSRLMRRFSQNLVKVWLNVLLNNVNIIWGQFGF